jgi:hypothetical protein
VTNPQYHLLYPFPGLLALAAAQLLDAERQPFQQGVQLILTQLKLLAGHSLSINQRHTRSGQKAFMHDSLQLRNQYY